MPANKEFVGGLTNYSNLKTPQYYTSQFSHSQNTRNEADCLSGTSIATHRGGQRGSHLKHSPVGVTVPHFISLLTHIHLQSPSTCLDATNQNKSKNCQWLSKHFCTTVTTTWLLSPCLLTINPLKPELNPICYLLALLAHHFLHVSRIRVKSLTFRRLMSYICVYIYIYIYIYIWNTHSWCF